MTTTALLDPKEITRDGAVALKQLKALITQRPEKEKLVWKEQIGFRARAQVLKNGEVISCAEAECLKEEKNWESKPRFQLLSMAQTRACAKALRNCLQWVVRLPSGKDDVQLSEEVAEEVQGQF